MTHGFWHIPGVGDASQKRIFLVRSVVAFAAGSDDQQPSDVEKKVAARA
jgi:hypothetical protein